MGTGRWAEDTPIIHSGSVDATMGDLPISVASCDDIPRARRVVNYAARKTLGKALDAITKGSELLTRLEEGTKKSTEGNLPM